MPGDFARLAFEQFRGGLHRYLLRRLRHADHAQDLAQEVYLRLLRFTDGELIERPEAYVYRVAFHVLCEFKLREQRERLRFDSEAVSLLTDLVETNNPAPEDSVEQQQRKSNLDAILEQLPPMQRAVFLLAVRHDLAHEEIAARLNISLHTVRKYLYRAMHFCRQKLSP